MKFGADSPKVDREDVHGADLCWADITNRKGYIHFNKKYLDTLSDEQLLDLYDTIIHEGLHFTRPAKLQTPENNWEHAYIYPEAARRSAKDQSDYNNERHKCGGDQGPLTLSIHPPKLPQIYLPKM